MDYNIHKICRICLEEGALTSIFSTEFAMMPSTMIMLCAKIRVYKSDGLPAVICNNCIYRLGVAYHFKQECENSDIRLRQYLGLNERGYGFCDAQTNTDDTLTQNNNKRQRFLEHLADDYNTDEEQQNAAASNNIRKKRRTRYQRKPAEQHKKRGPKPLPKLPQTCYECQKTFKCAAQLQMHMRTHTGEKPYACSYCARRFAQKYNLRIHERTHTGERPFQCEICSKQFSALGNFQAHQKIHTGIRDQLCPVCQKAFYSAGDLSKHMITHTAIKQHACHVCGKTFSRERDMHAHKRKVHGVNVDTNSVTQGGDDDDVTDDEVAVQVGVNSDTVAAVNVSDCFKCPDCNKEFSTAGSLSVHFRTHASGNLLNLPAGPAPPPPPHHAHYATATPMHHMHDGLHHTHHLGGGIQTAANVGATTGMSMSMSHHHAHAHHHHASMTHMLPHAPPPPPPPSAMHAQRLHPY